MNEVLEALFARKSMRAYTGEAVPAEKKELILRAACAAPTAGNQQLYTILDITDQAVKDKLAVSCDNQPFIAEAEVVLIFCADCHCRPERGDRGGQPGVWLLLYRGHYGTVRDPPGAAEPAGVCVPGSHAGDRRADAAAAGAAQAQAV